jgi:N6-L-threonylcarbamoyladenine synthase
MEEKPEFPFLGVVVSGGHTLLLLVESFTEIKKLGSTVDDAAGEAFDKVAKMLGLGYPGGPNIQKAAFHGNPGKIKFPVADLKDQYNFSFSGLKTSVLRYVQNNFGESKNIPEQDLNDISASFQEAVVKALSKNTVKALNNFDVNSISLAGGVAANRAIREEMTKLGAMFNKKIVIPRMEFCGDNAAMIAFRGMKLYEAGYTSNLSYSPFPGLSKEHFK